MLLPMDEKQSGFWKMRCSGTTNITIANLPGISRQAVSKALLGMDEKIESILREMAQANQIIIDKINPERESLPAGPSLSKLRRSSSSRRNTGSRSGTNMTATVVLCRRYTGDYATWLGIRIEKSADPTKMAEEFFMKVKALL